MNATAASMPRPILPPCGRLTETPLPEELGTCLVVHDFLSVQECEDLIARAERRGFHSAEPDYPPSYRNNERQVDDDPEFARTLFARLCVWIAPTIEDRDASGAVTTWRLAALNERIRWCRYGAGQRFNVHRDGVHHRGRNCRSRLTFIIYLSGPEAFEGGDTLFYASGPRADGESGAAPVVARVRPRAGSLIVFEHSIWHAGDTVTCGVKHILRSDLLYSCQVESCARLGVPFTPEHEGYVWALAKLQDGRIASAGRDATIRLWSPEGHSVGVLRGHRQSVLGLSEVEPGILASVSRDRSVRLWDMKTHACLREVGDSAAAVLSIAKLREGVFATGSADSTISVRNGSGALLHTLRGHTCWVWALARVNANTLASASEDGSVRLWNVDDGTCMAALPGSQPLRTLDAQTGLAGDCAHRLLATGDVSGWVSLWAADEHAAQLVHRFRAHDAAVRRVRFLSGNQLATCGEDQRVRVWELGGQRLLFEHRRPNFVTDVLQMQSGNLICSGYEGGLCLLEGQDAGYRSPGHA